jgi:hypothetical protein
MGTTLFAVVDVVDTLDCFVGDGAGNGVSGDVTLTSISVVFVVRIVETVVVDSFKVAAAAVVVVADAVVDGVVVLTVVVVEDLILILFM